MLKNYEAGRVENKPKVLKEIARREKEREEMAKNALKNQENKLSGISIKNSKTNQVKELTINECKQIMIGKMNECENLKNEINKLKIENDKLKKENDDLKNKLD